MFQKEQCITQQDILQKTESNLDNLCTIEHVFFWSNVQYSILNDVLKRRVVFTSPFGTGKTTLLKAKAKELMEQDQNVVFILFDDFKSTKDSLLKKTYEIEFGNRNNIKIYSLKGTGET